LKLLIFTKRELMIVKACDPARLNAPTKPCSRAGVSVVRDGGCRGPLPLPFFCVDAFGAFRLGVASAALGYIVAKAAKRRTACIV